MPLKLHNYKTNTAFAASNVTFYMPLKLHNYKTVRSTIMSLSKFYMPLKLHNYKTQSLLPFFIIIYSRNSTYTSL